MTRWSVVVGLGLMACGGGSSPIMGPNEGRGASGEVSIRGDQAKPEATDKPSDSSGSGSGSGGAPVPLLASDPKTESTFTPTPADTATTTTVKPRNTVKIAKGGGGKLTAKECDEMVDKYIEVTIAGPGGPLAGMSGKELEQARTQLKAMASTDPSFKGLQTSCIRDATHSQYECALSSTSGKEWQQCVR